MPRLRLVILAATPTPYFDHLHRRLAAEVPRLDLHVLYTHARPGWPMTDVPGVRQKVMHRVETDWDPSFKAKVENWRLGKRLIGELRRLGPSAVVVNGYADPSRWRVLAWCRRNRVPAFAFTDANVAGAQTAGRRAWVKRRYIGLIDTSLAGWLGCGRLTLGYLQAFGVDPRRVVPAPYEPAYDRIDAMTSEEVARRTAALGLPAGRTLAVCSGRMVPSKRHDRALAAFAAVAERRPELDLVLLGDGPEMLRLRAAIPENLAGRVHLPGFVQDERDVFAVYRRSAVLIHVPDHEPWGLVINEAAWAGAALVCTDVVGAAAELLQDGVNGHVVRHGPDEAATAAAVEALLKTTDPARLAAYQAASRNCVAAWREAADPVAGIRQSLHAAGLLPGDDPTTSQDTSEK
ncbi:MAG: glycosyltransferase family 4 protein [Phycisphaerae bacterium]